jgi:hypothetical protein
VVVPVLVALVVLVNVVGGRPGPAEVSAPRSSSSATLPPVTVQAPPVTPAADASCSGLVEALPQQLVGEVARKVSSASPYVRAWGNPAVVLVCGVDRPAQFTVGAGLIQVNGVQWFVDISDPKTVVWTAVDRPVYVQVRVPASTDSAPVTELTSPITKLLPAQTPQPGS